MGGAQGSLHVGPVDFLKPLGRKVVTVMRMIMIPALFSALEGQGTV